MKRKLKSIISFVLIFSMLLGFSCFESKIPVLAAGSYYCKVDQELNIKGTLGVQKGNFSSSCSCRYVDGSDPYYNVQVTSWFTWEKNSAVGMDFLAIKMIDDNYNPAKYMDLGSNNFNVEVYTSDGQLLAINLCGSINELERSVRSGSSGMDCYVYNNTLFAKFPHKYLKKGNTIGLVANFKCTSDHIYSPIVSYTHVNVDVSNSSKEKAKIATPIAAALGIVGTGALSAAYYLETGDPSELQDYFNNFVDTYDFYTSMRDAFDLFIDDLGTGAFCGSLGYAVKPGSFILTVPSPKSVYVTN